MSAIPGIRFDITGASGSQGLLGPKASWRSYVFPRGGYASAASTGTLITFDSSAIAGRFAALNWIQAGLNTANIRQVAAVGGNSLSVSGAALTIAENDYIFLIGNTQPTVTGGSATYTIPATIIRQRDDDGADLYVNSMVTTNSDGLVQFFSEPAVYDVLIQDGNQANQGSIIALPVGVAEGISTSFATVFGATVTINAAFGVTGVATFGQTVTMNAALGVTGWATFGSTVTMNASAGVTGTFTVGQTITAHANVGFTGNLVIAGSATLGASGIVGGLSVTTGIFGVSNQPRTWLYASSASILGGVSTTLVWDQEDFDVGSMHTGTTSQIVIPAGAGGLYLLMGQFSGNSGLAIGAGGATISIFINKNSARSVFSQSQFPTSITAPCMYASCMDIAAAGDRYELVFTIPTGSSISGGTRSNTFFGAVKLF